MYTAEVLRGISGERLSEALDFHLPRIQAVAPSADDDFSAGGWSNIQKQLGPGFDNLEHTTFLLGEWLSWRSEPIEQKNAVMVGMVAGMLVLTDCIEQVGDGPAQHVKDLDRTVLRHVVSDQIDRLMCPELEGIDEDEAIDMIYDYESQEIHLSSYDILADLQTRYENFFESIAHFEEMTRDSEISEEEVGAGMGGFIIALVTVKEAVEQTELEAMFTN